MLLFNFIHFKLALLQRTDSTLKYFNLKTNTMACYYSILLLVFLIATKLAISAGFQISNS